MSFDWQTIAVALIVLAALAYVLRRGWARLRSFGAGARATTRNSCGSCDEKTPAADAPHAKVLVQIGRARAETRKGSPR